MMVQSLHTCHLAIFCFMAVTRSQPEMVLLKQQLNHKYPEINIGCSKHDYSANPGLKLAHCGLKFIPRFWFMYSLHDCLFQNFRKSNFK